MRVMRLYAIARSVLMLVVTALAAFAPAAAAEPRASAEIQLLSVSDWHAQLDPLSIPGLGNVGGAAVLSSYFKAERAANPNTLTLTAGDAFGASPPLASFFDEEPAVKAMNLMGFDADTLGNHNFDRGVAHLRRMTELAEFPFLSANLADPAEELPAVAPYRVFDVGAVKVGVIGITNEDAPGLVKPGSFGTTSVTEAVQAAQKARSAAKREGAVVFVALVHMGVTRVDPVTAEPSGPLVDFAEAVGGFDVILGDHTNVEYAGEIGEALVVENRSHGRSYARTLLTVDPRNGRVESRSSRFVTPLASAVAPDASVEEMLAPYRAALRARMDERIGQATAAFPRTANNERLREIALGNLVADAMRERYATDIAFTNGGGLRKPLPSDYMPLDTSLRRTAPGYAFGPPYDLVAGDALAVLPFGNKVVTRVITGEQLWRTLEHSVALIPSASGRFLQVAGFRITYDSRLPAGSRVVSVTLDDGRPVWPDPTAHYTLATNDFLNAGGDGYTVLADGRGVTREVMADVLLDHIRDRGAVTPVVEGRIVDQGG